MGKGPDWNDTALEDAPDGVRNSLDEALRPSTPPAPWRTALQLQQKKFPPIRFVVPGYIVEGCTLFAGRPKIGKSWLMLEVALAVAMGRDALGDIPCEQGDALYLALEDNERRLQNRITKLIGAAREDWPETFHYATEWPRLKEGGLELIREWIPRHGDARLVVIDVLAMVRAPGNPNAIYQADYDTMKSLQQISLETGIAVVVVTHVRKARPKRTHLRRSRARSDCPARRTLSLSWTAIATGLPSMDAVGILKK